MAILARNLTSAGHSVNLITQNWTKGNDYVDEYSLDKNSIQVISERSYLKGIPVLRRMISNIQPEIVMSWDIRSSFWLLVLSHFSKWKFVNGSIRHGIVNGSFEHKLRTKIAQLSPYVIANSEAGLQVNGMSTSEKRKILYNAVDIPELDQEQWKNKRSDFLNKHFSHWDESDSLIISVANLLPYKDYPTVLEALSELDNQSFRYVIIGEGIERKNIEAKIVELGLDNRVSLIGRRNDVQSFLWLGDVFLHSSKGEGCSNAILEAMAAGIPVVASAVGGTPEILNENLGKLFEYRNKESLKAALKEILAWDRRGQKFMASGPAHMSNFSNEAITAQFEQIFKKWLS